MPSLPGIETYKFVEAGVTVTLCAPSNQATDVLARKTQDVFPQLGTIRFHALNTERIRWKHWRSEAATIVSFNRTLVKARVDPNWHSPKKQRPELNNISLWIRASQVAGVQIPKLPTPEVFQVKEPLKGKYIELRTMIEDKTGKDTKNRWIKGLDKKVSDFLYDTLRRAHLVVTTCKNSADKVLNEARKSAILIDDEACQGTEPEVLLPWIIQRDNIEHVIFVGNFCQLRPTVITAGFNAQDNTVNPLSHQLMLSFPQRMVQQGVGMLLLTEQFRATSGLEDVYDKPYYHGLIQNAEYTKLENRPKSKEAIDWINTRHKLNMKAPYVCLHAQSGMCVRDDGSLIASFFNTSGDSASKIRLRLKLHPERPFIEIHPGSP